ncbi:hypothetical protein ACOMHN_060102 [Nucella lapillus]
MGILWSKTSIDEVDKTEYKDPHTENTFYKRDAKMQVKSTEAAKIKELENDRQKNELEALAKIQGMLIQGRAGNTLSTGQQNTVSNRG